MTDKAYLIDKIAKLQAENNMLRKMQPIELKGNAITAFTLAAELSEKDAIIKKLAEYINELDIDEDVCKKVKFTCHEREWDCLKCIVNVLGRGR